MAVPDIDFAQEPLSEAQPPTRRPELKEPRQEQEYYNNNNNNNYQTEFLAQPSPIVREPQHHQHHQQYPVLGVQRTTGIVSSDAHYPSHYGANNYYVKPALSYYGNRVEGTTRNNEGHYYCRNYYGYLQPCHNWSNTIGGWWTDN